MNELPTSKRRRFFNNGGVDECPFCSLPGADAIEHWEVCSELIKCANDVFGQANAIRMFECFFLRTRCDPGHLKRFCAFIHGVWRCRNALCHGTTFSSYGDFCHHMRMIIEDPWLHGLIPDLDRKGRRSLRITPPESKPGAYVYNSDGASRHRGGERFGSCGVVFQRNDQQIARLGVYLGDVTNNVAEYEGIRQAMIHALRLPAHGALQIYFRVDSMLVKRQVLCEIACRSADLQPFHETCMSMLRELRRRNQDGNVQIEHVYREFNADADGTANEAIDGFISRIHADGIVVNEHWDDTPDAPGNANGVVAVPRFP